MKAVFKLNEITWTFTWKIENRIAGNLLLASNPTRLTEAKFYDMNSDTEN